MTYNPQQTGQQRGYMSHNPMNFPSIQNGFGQQNHIGIMNPQVQPQQVPIQFVPSIQNGFGQQNHIRIASPQVQPQQEPNQFGSLPTSMQIDAAIWSQLGNLTAKTNHLMKEMKENQTTKDNVQILMDWKKQVGKQQSKKRKRRQGGDGSRRK